MASKKHYTEVDKKTFLGILKKFSHIVENKKSDASSLKSKEDAWQQITEQYNISAVISCKRSAAQLKKMWSNMKSAQRNNLMKEKQSRMATGGGPADSLTEIDPEITEIVPTLMKTAPSVFSSNFTGEDMMDKRDVIFDSEYISDNLIEMEDDTDTTLKTTGEISCMNTKEVNDEDYEDHYSINNRSLECRKDEIDVIVDDTLQRRKLHKNGTTVSAAPKIDYDERRLKLERIRRIMKNEEELVDLKKRHEEEYAHLKQRHEEEKHKLEIEFLKARYALEIRTVTAVAKKAELQLKRDEERHEH